MQQEHFITTYMDCINVLRFIAKLCTHFFMCKARSKETKTIYFFTRKDKNV